MKREEAQNTPRVPNPEELFEEIRGVSYEIYEARMASGAAGDEITDWLDAEAQVRAKYGI